MDTLDETHRNITRVLEEQNLRSIAMGRLATSNTTLYNQLLLTQQNLQELANNEDARHAQMADHWQCMDALDLIIQQVGNCITTTINQNLLLNAQMKGIRTMIETAAAAVCTDITDLRGRIIPDLHSALASLKSKVSELHNLSVSLKSEVLDLQEQVTTIKGTLTSTSRDHPPPALVEATRPIQPDGMQEPRETTSPSPPDEQPRPLEGEVTARSNTTDGRPPPNR
jgi:hypothetical protein